MNADSFVTDLHTMPRNSRRHETPREAKREKISVGLTINLYKALKKKGIPDSFLVLRVTCYATCFSRLTLSVAFKKEAGGACNALQEVLQILFREANKRAVE